MASVAQIYRYPVKGLSAESLERVTLSPGEGLPADRSYAIAHSTAPFDPAAPQWLQKTHFLMLMKNERLAALECRFDDASDTLTVLRDGKQVARGSLREQIGRKLIEQFFAAYMKDEVRGSPRVVHAEGHMFSDSRHKSVSIIGLASLRDLERVVRRSVHPLRFRANLYLEGTNPWEEFNWVDREIRIGAARLRIRKRIDRCPATDVDPLTAARDMQIPLTLQDAFGHQDCGVFGDVIDGGEIAIGSPLEILR